MLGVRAGRAFFVCCAAVLWLWLPGGCIDRRGAMGYHDVRVTSVPEGAKVKLRGQVLGTTPVVCTLERDEWHRLRIELEGYHPVNADIGPESRPAHGPRLVTTAVPGTALVTPGSELLALLAIVTVPLDAVAWGVTETAVAVKSLDVAPMPEVVSIPLERIAAGETARARLWLDLEREQRAKGPHAGVDRPAKGEEQATASTNSANPTPAPAADTKTTVQAASPEPAAKPQSPAQPEVRANSSPDLDITGRGPARPRGQ